MHRFSEAGAQRLDPLFDTQYYIVRTKKKKRAKLHTNKTILCFFFTVFSRNSRLRGWAPQLTDFEILPESKI